MKEEAFFVYVLYSKKSKRFYIGMSGDPDQRLLSHNNGKVKSTKAFRPWIRVKLELLNCKDDALKREKYLKSGWGRKELKKHLITEGWSSLV